MDRGTSRIIDANFNRSREGLRVCEEVARFVLNSPALTKEFKRVRHNVSNIMSKRALCGSRDVKADVGRAHKSKSELKRTGYEDIFLANIERVKESLRVLEEFFKLINTGDSMAFARLRFKVYDIEKRAIKKITTLRNNRQRNPDKGRGRSRGEGRDFRRRFHDTIARQGLGRKRNVRDGKSA